MLLPLQAQTTAGFRSSRAHPARESPQEAGRGRHPILFNYFKYYIRRAREEDVWVDRSLLVSRSRRRDDEGEAALEHAIQVAAAKARSNWRLAAPQFYWPHSGETGRVQLLLPLSLINPDRVDLALVVDRYPSYAEHPDPTNACYRAYTVLPLEWAYRNARLVTRPEEYWLDIDRRGAEPGE
jgi:hypothetical protein